MEVGNRTIAAGALGSRLAGRLTADLVLRSPQYMSCVNEYEIDFRGNKIAAIENLGATQNQFDSIDLSDNAILILEGFPKLPRLKSVLLNNNRIQRIGRNLEESVPALNCLILTNNRIKNLQDINALSTLPNLQYLSLIGNEVAKKPNYRLYVIHRLKKLKHLDFRKVSPKDREEAERTFGGEGAAEKTFEPGEGLPEVEAVPADEEMEEVAVEQNKGPTPEQITAIKAAIQNAATLQEVAELEKALATGQVPSQFEDIGNGGEKDANGDAATMEEG